jgi:hypothetical protein
MRDSRLELRLSLHVSAVSGRKFVAEAVRLAPERLVRTSDTYVRQAGDPRVSRAPRIGRRHQRADDVLDIGALGGFVR